MVLYSTFNSLLFQDRRNLTISAALHALAVITALAIAQMTPPRVIPALEISATFLVSARPEPPAQPRKMAVPAPSAPRPIPAVPPQSAPTSNSEPKLAQPLGIAETERALTNISATQPAQPNPPTRMEVNDPQPAAKPTVSAETTEPRFDADYLSNPTPQYPSLSRRLGQEGRVLLRVYVDTQGRPQEVHLLQSSRFKRLDEVAIDTVRRWQFIAAMRGGTPVNSWVQVPILFQLRR